MDTTNFEPVPTAPPSDQNLNQYQPQQFTQYNLPPPSYNQAVMDQNGQNDKMVYQPLVGSSHPLVGTNQQQPIVVQLQAGYQPQVGATSNIEPIAISRIPDEQVNNENGCNCKGVMYFILFLYVIPGIIGGILLLILL